MGSAAPHPRPPGGAARYLGGACHLDEDGHVLVPHEGQVVAAADGHVQHQVQGASLHPEVHVGVRPADCVVPIGQHDGQALWDRPVTGLPAPSCLPAHVSQHGAPSPLRVCAASACWPPALWSHHRRNVLEHHGYYRGLSQASGSTPSPRAARLWETLLPIVWVGRPEQGAVSSRWHRGAGTWAWWLRCGDTRLPHSPRGRA